MPADVNAFAPAHGAALRGGNIYRQESLVSRGRSHVGMAKRLNVAPPPPRQWQATVQGCAEFLESMTSEDVRRYAGQWMAVASGEIVAHEKTLDESTATDGRPTGESRS